MWQSSFAITSVYTLLIKDGEELRAGLRAALLSDEAGRPMVFCSLSNLAKQEPQIPFELRGVDLPSVHQVRPGAVVRSQHIPDDLEDLPSSRQFDIFHSTTRASHGGGE